MSARRLAFVMMLTLLAGIAAPAHALVVAGPIDAVPDGCIHDAAAATSDELCTHLAPGLGGPAALAIAGPRVFVASADESAVTALSRRGRTGTAIGGPSPRSRHCVTAAPSAACSRIVFGLSGVDALAASPDGRDIYAGSRDDQAVVGLATATLDPIAGACLIHRGRRGCAATGALRSVGALAMAPDGRQVYAATFGTTTGQDTLVTLARSVHSGALHVDHRAPCIQSQGSAPAVCPARAAGLEGLTSIVVTADGRFVYAASPISSAVVGFLRNRATGRLTPLAPGAGGCVHDSATGAAGNQGCATATPGLRGARNLALSRDGATLIVVAGDPGSVVALARNPSTGALAPKAGGCLSAVARQGCTLVGSLRGAQAAVVTADGAHLVVVALGANAVLALSLDPSAGTLTAPSTPLRDLGGPSGPVALAAGDGHAIYVASALDDSVVTLVQSPTAGAVSGASTGAPARSAPSAR